MIDALRKFHATEDGAVTVDWVVLTAAIVGISLGIIMVFSDAIFGASGLFIGSLDQAMDRAAEVNALN